MNLIITRGYEGSELRKLRYPLEGLIENKSIDGIIDNITLTGIVENKSLGGIVRTYSLDGIIIKKEFVGQI